MLVHLAGEPGPGLPQMHTWGKRTPDPVCAGTAGPGPIRGRALLSFPRSSALHRGGDRATA